MKATLNSKVADTISGRIVGDQRLSVSHCCIFMSLILLYQKNGMTNPFPMSRKHVMELSHVQSTATYHKCLEQLQTYGYIKYNPSFSYYKRSTIYIENILTQQP